MVQITEDLLKKRAEHNEGVLYNLQEIALHQQEIEKIELLGEMCKHLVILYLQNNLISRIENLHKLKELSYLNLALNNIKVIEGLDGCESLTKLDLTVNFIEKLDSVRHLRGNVFLSELYLTGNPCTQIEGYREFVVAVLPQLKKLDGIEIDKAERIRARHVYSERFSDDDSVTTVQPENSEYTAESRTDMYREMAAKRKEQEDARNPAPPPPPKQIKANEMELTYAPDGRILQRNEGHYKFKWGDSDDGSCVLLDVDIPKFLDSSLVDVDVEPLVVRIVIKGKGMVLVPPCEVNPSQSTAQRSIVSGHLMISMRKHEYIVVAKPMHRKRTVEVKDDHYISGEAHDAMSQLANIALEGECKEEEEEVVDETDVPPLL